MLTVAFIFTSRFRAYWDKTTKIWAFLAGKRLNKETLAADELGNSTHFSFRLSFS
jgi:hypothetical protein